MKGWVDALLLSVDRKSIARFNTLFVSEKTAFRYEMGKIIAENAAKGTLQSGYTIKRSYRAMEVSLDTGVDNCLALISNKTQHLGWRRKRLLSHLEQISAHFAASMNTQLTVRLAFILDKSGDAASAADRLFEAVQERRSQRIGNFADGVTSPRDEAWHTRHPLIAGGVGALIALIAASFFGIVSGLIK